MQFFHIQGTQLTIYLKMKYVWFLMTLLDFLLKKIQSKIFAYATMNKKRANQKEIDLEKDIQKLRKVTKVKKTV